MKKIITLSLSVILLLGTLIFSVQPEAATLTSKAGAVATVSGGLNVRASASTGAKVVSVLKKGSYITLISKSGSWWKVEYADGQYGYCHADYIKIVAGTPAKVAVNSGNLNVRSGGGLSYGITARLPKGKIVLLLNFSGGWSQVLYHGLKSGYVSSQYLSAEISESAPISLSVPYYKQTDKRWANVKLGTSGKTISDIGCATTAIAMMESYRTGATIYPDAMSKKLKYTSGGSVYWPSNFIAVTDSSGYLNEVYQLLKQGKPVLFGGKNTYGGQHWVVITGFTGGETIAENFTINDPGTNTRTNLQQFLNKYPRFYKYFYYQS